MRRVRFSLVVVALVATACGHADAGTDPLVSALCDAIAAEDTASATDVFEDRVHRPLHELAEQLQSTDAGAAGRLLEAKYDVETVLRHEDPGPRPLVRDRLDVLLQRVRQGLQALDRPAPSC